MTWQDFIDSNKARYTACTKWAALEWSEADVQALEPRGDWLQWVADLRGWGDATKREHATAKCVARVADVAPGTADIVAAVLSDKKTRGKDIAHELMGLQGAIGLREAQQEPEPATDPEDETPPTETEPGDTAQAHRAAVALGQSMKDKGRAPIAILNVARCREKQMMLAWQEALREQAQARNTCAMSPTPENFAALREISDTVAMLKNWRAARDTELAACAAVIRAELGLEVGT